MKNQHNWRAIIVVAVMALLAVGSLGMSMYCYYRGQTYDGKMFLITGVLLALFALGLLIPLCIQSHKQTTLQQLFDRLPEQTAEARIIGKSRTTEPTRYATYVECHLIFEFADGERKSYQVTNETYDLHQRGDTGTLTYKSGEGYGFFVRFDRHRNAK